MASKTHVQFQLMGKKRPRNWQLPITGMMLPRYVDGKYKGNKQVEYIKGHDSIFKEDHIGDEKPSWVWFTDGLLDVSTGDLALLQILENHKMFCFLKDIGGGMDLQPFTTFVNHSIRAKTQDKIFQCS